MGSGQHDMVLADVLPHLLDRRLQVGLLRVLGLGRAGGAPKVSWAKKNKAFG